MLDGACLTELLLLSSPQGFQEELPLVCTSLAPSPATQRPAAAGGRGTRATKRRGPTPVLVNSTKHDQTRSARAAQVASPGLLASAERGGITCTGASPELQAWQIGDAPTEIPMTSSVVDEPFETTVAQGVQVPPAPADVFGPQEHPDCPGRPGERHRLHLKENSQLLGSPGLFSLSKKATKRRKEEISAIMGHASIMRAKGVGLG